MKLSFLEGEYWYGGCVTEGIHQPYGIKSNVSINNTNNPTPNQTMPLFISNCGRWLWREQGFDITFFQGVIHCPDDVEIGKEGETLRTAYLGVMKKHFPFHLCNLSQKLFQSPVYNTWIELTFYQTEQAVLSYAEQILLNGLPPGVLMIDDGWSDYYGKWKFSKEKFQNPKEMIEKLHQWGFSVMLWICPYITPDTLIYRELEEKNLLVKNAKDEVHIAKWWNGWSSILDMSKDECRKWLDNQLEELMKIGVDGFKFDGGDSMYYPIDTSITGDEHSKYWASYGEKFSFNEFRVTAGAGGWSLMQRLCDKEHSWGDKGLAALIPNALIQGLTGHPYCCPDMIGGGEYRNFLSQGTLDEELFVRHGEVACLMPVMQFSAAPWRVLSTKNYEKVKTAIQVRTQFQEKLNIEIRNCMKTGEPIIRTLEYVFPHQGLAEVMDEFLIGDSVLVAPVLEKGVIGRKVVVPKGTWIYNGTILKSNGKSLELKSDKGLPIILIRKDNN